MYVHIQVRSQKRSIWGARFKQIEYSGQKKIYFLPYDLYFSVNRGGDRAPADAYLESARPHLLSLLENGSTYAAIMCFLSMKNVDFVI
jgi:hypothetical protein